MANGDLSTQFEKISDKAKAAADKLKAANGRTRDQLESDVADARQSAEAAADGLKAKADDAGDAASSHWRQLRGKWQGPRGRSTCTRGPGHGKDGRRWRCHGCRYDRGIRLRRD